MTDYEAIYLHHAEAYDLMVQAEDTDKNLPRILRELVSLRGAQVVEVGVGTGRVTSHLVAAGCRVQGFERAPAMLEVARRRFGDQVELHEADARALPLGDGVADLCVAGWVLGHMTHWEGDMWREAVQQAVGEMKRVVRVGGNVVIIETLGTGKEEAAPPNDGLAAYYALLEEDGFVRHTIRTDFQFGSAQQAADTTRFFFGDDFAQRVLDQSWARIPEHTGVWHLAK